MGQIIYKDKKFKINIVTTIDEEEPIYMVATRDIDLDLLTIEYKREFLDDRLQSFEEFLLSTGFVKKLEIEKIPEYTVDFVNDKKSVYMDSDSLQYKIFSGYRAITLYAYMHDGKDGIVAGTLAFDSYERAVDEGQPGEIYSFSVYSYEIDADDAIRTLEFIPTEEMKFEKSSKTVIDNQPMI